MRVNVFKSLSISKTFMKSGLKFLKYHYSLRKIKTKTKTKSKSISISNAISNNLTLGFYLNLYTNVTKTLLYLEIIANLLVNFAIFASHKQILIEYFTFNIIGYSRLTVLMNVFRLKTFFHNNNNYNYNSNSIIHKSFKLINFQLNKSSSITNNTKQLPSELTTTLATSSSSSSSLIANNFVLFRSSSSYCNSNKSNHYRTFNNSKKSNKVFLYYTPRDPRLRIFLKTKHFSSRPFSLLHSVTINKNHSNTSDNILNDLCNYGELIGGGVNNNTSNSCGNFSAHKRVQFRRVFDSVNV